MNKKNNIRKGITISLITCALLLVSFLSSYAFFINAIGNNKNEDVSVQTGTLALTFSDGNNGFAKELDFGGSAEKTFKVENTGSVKATFSILWMNMLNTYLEESLTYTLEESDTEDGTYTPLVTNKNVPTTGTRSDKPLMSGIEIEPNTTKYYKLIITLNYLERTDQTSDLSATLDAQFKIVEGIFKEPTQAERILAKLGKTSKSSEGLDFANLATTDETADGLFELEDDYGTSYFYRGDVTDNYVKFGKWSETSSQTAKRGNDMYWRIIRINGDGSVRLLYDGTSAHTNSDTSEDRVAIQNQVFNNYSNDAKYVGYMYSPSGTLSSTSKEQAQMNIVSSSIKLKLEEWYVENIKNQNLDEYIADSIFCYDRTIPGKDKSGYANDTGLGYGNHKTAYGAYMRAISQNSVKVLLTCEQKIDSFTVNDTSKGNGKLDQKVGLITFDESIAAGGKAGYRNTNFYLYKGVDYWTGSPFFGPDTFRVVCNNGGIINNHDVNYARVSLVPVINLTPEYFNTLIGDGTIENVFRDPNEE